MGAFGLQTHIWNNNVKSVLLLAGFPLLLLVLTFGLSLLMVAATDDYVGLAEGIQRAFENLGRFWPFALLGAGVWFLVAFFFHQRMIEASVGAKGLDRKDAPDIYNLLENLCISRGLATPRLNIIETPALNAFASGINDTTYAITLTRGLVDLLDRDELEAVIAHELTHIRNRDVRLLIIAVIFVGIFSFFGELFFRNTFRTGVRIGGHTQGRRGDSRGGGLLIIIAIALIVIAYLLAIVIRFTLSQKREYLADAGAVDLTRKPDAMIRALEKIAAGPALDAPSEVMQMMINNPRPFAGLFMTHPPITKRVAALRAYAM